MRRAALARWLNLSVIAAVIAVLTLVLVLMQCLQETFDPFMPC